MSPVPDFSAEEQLAVRSQASGKKSGAKECNWNDRTLRHLSIAQSKNRELVGRSHLGEDDQDLSVWACSGFSDWGTNNWSTDNTSPNRNRILHQSPKSVTYVPVHVLPMS